MFQSAHGNNNALANDGSTATVNVIYQAAQPSPVDPAAVAAAVQQLDTLPLDTLPAPAPLPAGSAKPPHPNRQFVGRAGEFSTLARVLKNGGAAIIGQSPVVTGSGGIGKSQLAAECAWRYGQFFAGGVFWLSFAEPGSIPAEIARCGMTMGLHADFAGLPLATQMELVSSRWQDGLPRLLVFDNCEDPKLFQDWCPPAGDCRVILTARRREWPGDLGLMSVPLDTLSRAESIALLRKHRPDLAEDDPILDAIAHELGDFPLALHLAGSYLGRYRTVDFGKPEVYLAALRRPDLLAHPSLTGGSCPNDHEAHVARTFAASTDRLDAQDPTDALALSALSHAAHLAPGEAIPPWLLARAMDLDWNDPQTQVRLIDTLRRLSDLGLIEQDDSGAPTLHRLIAAFARSEDATVEKTREAVEKAIYAAAYEQNESGLPGPLLVWQAHLRHVAEAAAEDGTDTAGALMNGLGYHLDMIGDLSGAKTAYQRAVDIGEKAFGPDHPKVAIRVNNLGSVLYALGDLDGARKAFQRALDIDEKASGPDHPEVATDVNNLGSVLRDLGDFDGAKAAFQRALDIDEKAFGSDHPDVATDVNNLGTVLHALGDLDGAKAAFHRALDIDAEAFGPNHPNVASGLNNLGDVLHTLGDRDGARAAYQRALRISEQTLGPDHPNTRIVRNNLNDLGP